MSVKKCSQEAKFPEEVKLKALLWSNRHCCLCNKPYGLDIEIAHIDSTKGNSFENAIPVCYEHHAQIGRYNEEHPRGSKFRTSELTKRREQVYDEHTRHLIPMLLWFLVPFNPPSQPERRGDIEFPKYKLPQVGFVVQNHSQHLSTRLKVNARAFLGKEEIDVHVKPKKPYYNNELCWNLNAGQLFHGNFKLDGKCIKSKKNLVGKL